MAEIVRSWPLLLVILVAYSGAFIAVHVLMWRKRRSIAKRRSPLTADLLRPAGHTLRVQLDELKDEMFSWMFMLVIMPLLAYSSFLTQAHLIERRSSWLGIGLFLLIGIGGFIYGTWKLWRLANRKEKLSIGLDAELAVGEELNQLMRCGAVVFHDIPAEGFNIDHVVAARSGIYAIETKGRAKLRSGDGRKDARVEFDGKELKFPKWRETEPIAQAERQAKWLQRWLSSAVGESVHVNAVLVLPGWYVERKGPNRVRVLSGREVNSIARGAAVVSDEMVQRIAHQLDQRCRTVQRALTPG